MRLCVEQYGLLGLPDPIPKDFEFKVNNRLDLNDKIGLLVGGAITTQTGGENINTWTII